MNIDVELIKQLRQATGAGVMEAKEALLNAKGDLEKAKEVIKQSGGAKAGKRAGRTTSAGVVDAYLHMERVGAMVELNCETDFVARTKEFKEFAHEVVMQVASMNPTYLSPDDIPAKIVKAAKDELAREVKAGGHPAASQAKIVEGKMAKFYQERCLLNQPSIMDPKITVADKLQALVAKLGENIQISRFVRYELGEN